MAIVYRMNDREPHNGAAGSRHRTPTSRRSFVTKATGTALGSAAALAGVGTGTDGFRPAPIDRETRLLRAGTEYETEAFINESTVSGPTAVVVGGVHGNEPAGSETAHRVTEWEFDRGTLVVVPEADAVAGEAGTYTSPNGNLNRQFPTGQAPTTELAAELWDLITEHDPAVVMDLHSSMGIRDSDRGPYGYGQAIYPSAVGDSEQVANETIDYMNENLVGDEYSSDHQFVLGNTQTGANPLLTHKVAGDLERACYLTEVTRFETDLAVRIEWAEAVVAHLLREHGIETSHAHELP